MRLLNPNVGESVDRQTILDLKCQAGVRQKKDVKEFVHEINAIQKYIETNWLVLAPKSIQHDYDTAYNGLAEVNKELWNLEDEIRSIVPKLKQSTSEVELSVLRQRVVEIAVRMPELNDRRAELVIELNKLFGVQTQEKIYTISEPAVVQQVEGRVYGDVDQVH